MRIDEVPDLKQFAHTDGKVLVKRSSGGLGDIIIHRMMFQDFKIVAPRARITVALPRQYMSVMQCHPFVDEVVDVEDVNDSDFAYVYDTTDIAGQYEYARLPNVDKHRSDIWAEAAGVRLRHHESFIRISDEEKSMASELFQDDAGDDRPRVAIAPRTASRHKNWDDDKWQAVIDHLDSAGYLVYSFHTQPTTFYNCSNVRGLPIRMWMASVAACDYVITLATSVYCLANALHKPTIAIFGCEDLDVFGKHFPEMIPVQRRSGVDGWGGQECPCWRNWCSLDPESNRHVNGEKQNLCMADIKAAEVIAAFDTLVKGTEEEKREYYNRDYFQTGGCKGWYDETAFTIENEFHKARAIDLREVLDLREGDRALEIGCALGNVAYWLRDAGIDAYGTDLSAWATMNSHLSPEYVRQADIARGVPFPETDFDMIFSREVLEHIPEDDVAAALANIAEMLRPGGVTMHWIATNRNAKEEKKRHNPLNYDESHVCIRGPEWWVERFAESGLQLDADLSIRAMHRPDAVRYDWDCLVWRKPTQG